MIQTRAIDRPVVPALQPAIGGFFRRLGKRLSALAYDVAVRLPSGQRDLSPEYFRFPWL